MIAQYLVWLTCSVLPDHWAKWQICNNFKCHVFSKCMLTWLRKNIIAEFNSFLKLDYFCRIKYCFCCSEIYSSVHISVKGAEKVKMQINILQKYLDNFKINKFGIKLFKCECFWIRMDLFPCKSGHSSGHWSTWSWW